MYTIRKNYKETKVSRVDLLDLKKTITKRGFPWEISNPILARKTVSDEGYEWRDFQ